MGHHHVGRLEELPSYHFQDHQWVHPSHPSADHVAFEVHLLVHSYQFREALFQDHLHQAPCQLVRQLPTVVEVVASNSAWSIEGAASYLLEVVVQPPAVAAVVAAKRPQSFYWLRPSSSA